MNNVFAEACTDCNSGLLSIQLPVVVCFRGVIYDAADGHNTMWAALCAVVSRGYRARNSSALGTKSA